MEDCQSLLSNVACLEIWFCLEGNQKMKPQKSHLIWGRTSSSKNLICYRKGETRNFGLLEKETLELIISSPSYSGLLIWGLLITKSWGRQKRHEYEEAQVNSLGWGKPLEGRQHNFYGSSCLGFPYRTWEALILPGKQICSLIGDLCHSRRQSCRAGCRVAMRRCVISSVVSFCVLDFQNRWESGIWRKGGGMVRAVLPPTWSEAEDALAYGVYGQDLNLRIFCQRGPARKDFPSIFTVHLCPLLSEFWKWLHIQY